MPVVRKLGPLLLAVLAAVVIAGPSGASETKTAVSVRLFEFKVVPKPVTAKRGVVAFLVRNTGKVDHELVVLKTNIPPAKLPVKAGKAVEKGRVGKVGPFGPGGSKALTLKLKAGKYILLCNVPGHYQAGQRIGFKVT